jgi:quercetin dioxygenase-like cupin family protein
LPAYLMAIKHLHFGEVVKIDSVVTIDALGSHLSEQASHALFKSDRIELIRWILQAGRGIPLHRMRGESLLHCIEGSVRIRRSGGGDVELHAGELVHIAPGEEHAIEAVSDSSVLATLVLA